MIVIEVADLNFYLLVNLLCFSCQLKRVMESDAAMTEDMIAYNIIPLESTSTTNRIVYFPEVSCWIRLELLRDWFFHKDTTLTWVLLFWFWLVIRWEQLCLLWRTFEVYQKCQLILYLPSEALICLTFCILFLGFRSGFKFLLVILSFPIVNWILPFPLLLIVCYATSLFRG